MSSSLPTINAENPIRDYLQATNATASIDSKIQKAIESSSSHLKYVLTDVFKHSNNIKNTQGQDSIVNDSVLEKLKEVKSNPEVSPELKDEVQELIRYVELIIKENKINFNKQTDTLSSHIDKIINGQDILIKKTKEDQENYHKDILNAISNNNLSASLTENLNSNNEDLKTPINPEQRKGKGIANAPDGSTDDPLFVRVVGSVETEEPSPNNFNSSNKEKTEGLMKGFGGLLTSLATVFMGKTILKEMFPEFAEAIDLAGNTLMALVGGNGILKMFTGKGIMGNIGGLFGGKNNTPMGSMGGMNPKESKGLLSYFKNINLGKLLKGGLFGAGIGLVGGALGSSLQESDDPTNQKLGKGIEVGSSIAGYATTGAMLGSIIPGVGTAIGGALGGALGLWLESENISDLLPEDVKQWFMDIPNKLSEVWDGIIDFVSNGLSDLFTGVSEKFGGIVDSISEGISSFIDGFGEKINGVIESVKDWFKGLFENIVGSFGNLLSGGSKLIDSIFGDVSEKASEATEAITETASNVVEKSKEFAGDVYDGAKNIVEDTVNSANNVFSEVGSALNSFGENVSSMFHGLFNTSNENKEAETQRMSQATANAFNSSNIINKLAQTSQTVVNNHYSGTTFVPINTSGDRAAQGA